VILNKDKLLETLLFCSALLKINNGYLINKANLKQAMSYLSNSAVAIGLTGTQPLHALRYTYSNLFILQLEGSAFSEREKYAMLSCSLGHSDGRGVYTKSVYARNLLPHQELNFDDLIINYPNLNQLAK
jgi:hypothetical protein